MAAGSWTLLEELFAAGAAEFVPELRRIHNGERLGDFAAKWFADQRPIARRFVLDYLDQPLNCYRHEALVKRLFKLAEKANDDELMGAFLVAFDRSVRRTRRSITRWKYEQFSSRLAAESAQALWMGQGYSNAMIYDSGPRFSASARRVEEVVRVASNTTMPRPAKIHQKRDLGLSDAQRAKYEKKFKLFSVATRKYLRRRAWRYFRKLGKADPKRYIIAARQFLLRYRDADIDSEIHLLDNWGLMNALFRRSPALAFKARGCEFAAGKSIADLTASPRFESAWIGNPDSVFGLLCLSQCRAIRRWAIEIFRKHHGEWLAVQQVPTVLQLLDSPDADVTALGFEYLEQASNLASVPVVFWLKLLESDDLDKLTRLSEFLKKHLEPARVPPETAIQLALHRSRPVASLGFELVKSKDWSEAEPLLALTEAECDSVRREQNHWFETKLESYGTIKPEWMLAVFDSRYRDIRNLGWQWLLFIAADVAMNVVPKLLESPYDDVRFQVLAMLKRWADLETGSLRGLWATVLTNIHRGGRQKPGVVAAIVDRLAKHPAEADSLLPLLAIAVRSVRGPEFRAGLAGLVQIANTTPELQPRVRSQFPEFELAPRQ